MLAMPEADVARRMQWGSQCLEPEQNGIYMLGRRPECGPCSPVNYPSSQDALSTICLALSGHIALSADPFRYFTNPCRLRHL